MLAVLAVHLLPFWNIAQLNYNQVITLNPEVRLGCRWGGVGGVGIWDIGRLADGLRIY